MKFLAILLAVILVASGAQALGVNFGKGSYYKGEVIDVSGQCGVSGRVNLTLEYSKKMLAGQGIDCNFGIFFFSYESSYLDPAGGWSAEIEGDGNSVVAKADVLATPKSAYYLITFLSPITLEHSRNDDVKVRVRVTDAGTPVEDAEVQTWDSGGTKRQLAPEGAGLYYFDYTVPYDTRATSWNIIVTAQKVADGERFGGESSLITEITKANINIEKVEPKTSTFELGESIPIAVKISYQNGKKVIDPVVMASVKDKELVMVPAPDGTFRTEYAASAGEEGGLAFGITAKDGAGNTGKISANVVAVAGPVWFIKSNILYIIMILVVAAISGRFVYNAVNEKLFLERLKTEREKTTELIKALQRDYFERATVPRAMYERSLSEHKTRLGELEKKIALMEEAGKKAHAGTAK